MPKLRPQSLVRLWSKPLNTVSIEDETTNLETKTEPNVKQAVPFFAVSNIEASVRYYVDGLGFEMTRKWMTTRASSAGAGCSAGARP